MATHLSSSVSTLPGIGEMAARDLKNLGVLSVADLLFYFPFRYDDFSQTKPIANLRHGDTATVDGAIISIKSRPAKNRHLTIVEAVVEDDSGEIKVVWFNQPYLVNSFPVGSKISMAGRVDSRFGGRTLVNPVYEPLGIHMHTGRLVPVYGLSGSLTMRRLRQAIRSALSAAKELEEYLPPEITATENFPVLLQAVNAIHYPDSKPDLQAAIESFKFRELFLHQLMYAEIRRERAVREAYAVKIDEGFLKKFVSTLPFTLTQAQRRAAWEVLQDCAKLTPMNRLLEGDVGSGKTMVAAITIAHAAAAGYKSAYLAPTEILATQQHASLSRFLPERKIGLLTSSICLLGQDKSSREELLENLQNGTVSCLVGTHALIQKDVALGELALVVVDEQHRFGVEQRHALLNTAGIAPHLLSMTATPIPRSLALTLYGDLELSILDELPKGRQPITTELVFAREQEKVWQHILSEIKKGRQAYVVCPLIDPSDNTGSLSVTQLASRLKKTELKSVRLGILHGKLKTDDKSKVMQDFKNGKLDVIVSTTVIEVGVDVPNATVMVIVGAEHFGLAQLHQLRGRVGRREWPSFCFLLPDTFSPNVKERMLALVHSQNGFELAEKDLLLRGAGNIFGTAQSGFPDFKLATEADVPLMKKARDWAAQIIKKSSKLEDYPLLAEQVKKSFDRVHLE